MLEKIIWICTEVKSKVMMVLDSSKLRVLCISSFTLKFINIFIRTTERQNYRKIDKVT